MSSRAPSLPMASTINCCCCTTVASPGHPKAALQFGLGKSHCLRDGRLGQQRGITHGFQGVGQAAEIAPHDAQHMPGPVMPQHRGQLSAITGQQALQFTAEFGFGQGLLQLPTGHQIQQQLRLAPQQIRNKGTAGQHAGQLRRFRAACQCRGQLPRQGFTGALQNMLPGELGLCGQRLRQVCGVQFYGGIPPMIRIQTSSWGATRMTSSMVVSPRATRAAPLRRRVRMPSPMAISRILATFSCGLICACTARLFTSTS